MLDADVETPYKRLARAVIAKAISDYLLDPTSQERREARADAELFLDPPDRDWQDIFNSWANLAGISATWFRDDVFPRLASARGQLAWSGTAFG